MAWHRQYFRKFRLMAAFATAFNFGSVFSTVSLYAQETTRESVDLAFIIEFVGLSDLIEGFEEKHFAARKPLTEFVDEIQRTNRFKGHKEYAKPLEASGRVYAMLARDAENAFVADPRNADMVESFANVIALYEVLFPKLAECARRGLQAYCLAVFDSIDGQPGYGDASDTVARVASEIVAAFEAKYGSFASARGSIQNARAESGDDDPPPESPVMFDIEVALSTLGFDPGPLDGVFDDRSQQALADLVAGSEGILPQDNALELLDALNGLMQQARDVPESRDWGTDPDLNRQLAAATGYLGGFGGDGFDDWVRRQPEDLKIDAQLRRIRRAALAVFRQSLKEPAASADQVLATLNTPDAAANACDRLAADPFDPAARAEGVALWDIDGKRAVAACEAALKDAPSEARFAFQLARAFIVSGQPERARPVFGALAANGHLPSVAHLGILAYLGLDRPVDLALARRYLSVAAVSSDQALRRRAANPTAGTGAMAQAPRDPPEVLPEVSYEPPLPTVLVPVSVIEPGRAPELAYAGLPVKGRHWLALSAPGLAGKDYYFLKMLPPGQGDGVITGPDLPAGNCEARLFLNWPDGGFSIVDTAPLKVVAGAAETMRKRQIMVELDSLLSGQDLPDLTDKLAVARTGGAAEIRGLAQALIVRATEYAAVSAEMADPEPYATALIFARIALELMPDDAAFVRSAGVLHLMAASETGLIFAAERLVGRAVEIDPADRLSCRLWIEALMGLAIYDAATQELKGMWPPLADEQRLIGLASDLYLVADRPADGLKLLDRDLPAALDDAANLARIALSFSAGQTGKTEKYFQALAASTDPYFAAIARNMMPEQPVSGPNPPVNLP
jgi:hypothetical protein